MCLESILIPQHTLTLGQDTFVSQTESLAGSCTPVREHFTEYFSQPETDDEDEDDFIDRSFEDFPPEIVRQLRKNHSI